MVLHTDEPHPHVHVVVKAVSEQGVRLNIRKELCANGDGSSRGIFAHRASLQTRRIDSCAARPSRKKLDGIYRPMRDPGRYSTHMQNKVESVAAELGKVSLRVEAGKSKLVRTRKEVERGWRAVSEILFREGQPELALHVERFVNQMPPAQTENEQLAVALLESTRKARAKEFPSPSR